MSISLKPPVHILDEDPNCARDVATFLQKSGFSCRYSDSKAGFWVTLNKKLPDAVVLSLDVEGAMELVLQLSLAKVLVIATQNSADVARTVAAMKAGAKDVLVKPFQPTEIAASITDALDAIGDKSIAIGSLDISESLTGREKEVLGFLMNGGSSKAVARELGLSPRTIDLHRANILRKSGAKNVADLVRIAMINGRAYQI